MRLSILIPARNEEAAITQMVEQLVDKLQAESVPYQVVMVDDGSDDHTADRMRELSRKHAGVMWVQNSGRNGYGMAVRAGLEHCSGDAITVMMADASDSPTDVVKYYRKLQEGYDCVFGSRFIRGATVVDYPMHKLILNRVGNWFIRILFGLRFNDVTNAFKCYRREVVHGISPLISPHFNLTVEMPLKAIVRGYSFAVVPVSWTNRKSGVSRLKINEMGSRYLFIVLYVWLEKHLSRGDYHRRVSSVTKGEFETDRA